MKMIEALDVKIAENPEEAFWTEFKDKCLKEIESNKRQIEMNKVLAKLAEEKLSEVKNGK